MGTVKAEQYKEVDIADIGLVKLKKRRGRSIRISLDRDGNIMCTMPYYSSQRSAIDFLLSKKEWILKHQILIKTRKRGPIDLTNGFKTRQHTLVLIPEIREDISTRIRKEMIEFRYPGQEDIKSSVMQKHIRHVIEEVWRLEAKSLLIQRTHELAALHGFKISKVSIRKTISRWGSCSYNNSISLSLYLMQLTDELMDMVILHELCHTVEKNHGPKYKALLKQVCPELPRLEKEIKRYSLYPF